MKRKLTPKQAFEHLKAVVPSLEYIEPGEGPGDCTVMKFVYDDGSRGIRQLANTVTSWGDCQRWPEEPEGTWRTPVLPADAGKKARFRDATDEGWVVCKLTGYSECQPYNWHDGDDVKWMFCEVFDPAPAKSVRKTRRSTRTRKPGK